MIYAMLFFCAFTLTFYSETGVDMQTKPQEAALIPPSINTSPGSEYATEKRLWQGIPGIERNPNGRLWAVWYSGGKGEGPDNYVVLVTSDDDGHTWSKPALVIDPLGRIRAFDPCLWHDPHGRLWLFWAQSEELFDGRAGVWAIVTENSDRENPRWSEPRRICNGVMMNKPVVLSTGEWCLPAAVWNREPFRDDMADERRSNLVCSTDNGRSWVIRGGADVTDRAFDEHMVVEKRDGSLWVLVRTKYGIGQAFSYDRGKTWTKEGPAGIPGPNSRFHIRRLKSGRILLINHHNFTGRSHLTAMLSEDDGKTWPHKLLLDERKNVSYPDSVEDEDGNIYAIYDRSRGGEKEILMAKFKEEDIIAGGSEKARLKAIVNAPK
jgi:predicted neuraminidase